MSPFLHGAWSASLPPMRLVSRVSQEYAGACPFCGGDQRQSDRFHIWLTPLGRERYWCRRCNRKGILNEFNTTPHTQASPWPATTPRSRCASPLPTSRNIPFYRQLYALVAEWAEHNLYEACNPEPLAYLHQRGFDTATIRWARLGYALRDPQALVEYLKRHAASLLPYACEAGILTHELGATGTATLRTHPSVCGRIVIPYLSQDQVFDLRARRFPGSGYASLPGSYAWRGATIPYCCDAVIGNEVLIITEGEFKALAATAATFSGASVIADLQHAIGQYVLYRSWMSRTEPERLLFLVVDREIAVSVFDSAYGQIVANDMNIQLLVIDMYTERIMEWRSFPATDKP